MTLFRPSISASDKMYKMLRDDPDLIDLRRRVEDLWPQFEPYADPDFIIQLAEQFHPRFWEMYLLNTLIELGHKPTPTGQEGPDLKIETESRPTWIEAKAPGPGQGPDAVPQPQGSGYVNEDKIVLRFQSAIKDKHAKACEYRQKGLISANDPFIVAVNGFQIPYAIADDEIPYAIQAVLPFGVPQVIVDIGNSEIVDTGYQHRPHIKKESGVEVPSHFFLDDTYSALSGVLYSNASAFNFKPLGTDFVYLHNPNAENPLPRGWLKTGREYWLEDGKLHHKR